MNRPDEQFQFNEFAIPNYMREPLVAYIDEHRPPGGFLTLVLENNLVGAMGKADGNNIHNLPAYGNFLYNHAPLTCWGSPDKVKAWLKGEDNGKE